MYTYFSQYFYCADFLLFLQYFEINIQTRAAREMNTTRMLINGNTLDRLILHLTDILEQPIDKSSPSTPGASPRTPLTPSIKAVQSTTSILEGGPKDVVHLLIQLIRWIFVFLFYKICYIEKII